MVIGGHRVQANEKFWTNVQELSGTVHLYGLLTTLDWSRTLILPECIKVPQMFISEQNSTHSGHSVEFCDQK